MTTETIFKQHIGGAIQRRDQADRTDGPISRRSRSKAPIRHEANMECATGVPWSWPERNVITAVKEGRNEGLKSLMFSRTLPTVQHRHFTNIAGEVKK